MIWNKTDKQALQNWEDFRQQIFNSTTVDANETEDAKKKRLMHLEANPEEWFKYYFPKYCFAEAADFQIKSTKKILKAERIAQARCWARGLSKSTRRMFEVLYIKLARRFRINALLISKTVENAQRLLMPYMISLDSNQRIINDYGIQEKPGSWTAGDFTDRQGCTFRAVGKQQNPRGTKNEELRVNVIIFDDVDDDEECRSEERLNQSWDWIMMAVLPTVDISKPYYIFFDNNIISPDSLALRFQQYANDIEIINIRDENGISVWPQKNSEKDIDEFLSLISYEAVQQEYFNNPMRQGQTFREITWGKCPEMKKLPFIVTYSDPSTSNRDKPLAKSKAGNSCKVVALVGYYAGKYYLYKCFNDVTTNNTFIDWLYAMRKHVGNATPHYIFVENNTLQDPFYEQVLLPLIYQKIKQNGGALSIIPDTAKKPEKWFRIEATLEPLVRLGNLVFNIDEKDNPHMIRMARQFTTAHPNSRTLDGPDAVQGAVQIIMNKFSAITPQSIKMYKTSANAKRY
jgi:hypothetical protein